MPTTKKRATKKKTTNETFRKAKWYKVLKGNWCEYIPYHKSYGYKSKQTIVEWYDPVGVAHALNQKDLQKMRNWIDKVLKDHKENKG